MARMPVVFFGHGSPMIALETNATTRRWAATAARIEREYGRPRAILCISAHWMTQGIAVTAMAAPRTIHDFGAFPQTLFDVQYPAPGDPALAARVRDLIAPMPVALDHSEWGLDHGTWSVLCKAYPNADMPVVQLSMDASRDAGYHYDIGRRLLPLRDEGVLIVGTGNIVHNLRRMDFYNRNAAPFDWAMRFNDHVRNAILTDTPGSAIEYAALGRDAQESVPDPDHYWPLLYVLGARDIGDAVEFGPDHIEHGSLSMTSILLAPSVH
ncbi:4,5-DOPA dioxygenase extradiol [Lichenicoccus sp.]|uniref:4,5-DOPA-extradiol-dioxygenase n=1 Tax=Lichenicoccus sp. TaxID=2781899 RepID=UPI003D0A9610